jgi:hypothetical protein
MGKNTDTGLGLAEFLATPAVEPASTEVSTSETTTELVKTEEAKTTEPETKVEEKGQVAEKPVGTETKTDSVADTKIEELKPDPWEDDANPYKQKFTVTEKRRADAEKWANQNNMDKLELQRQMKIINQKLDGTYDPEAEAKANEVQPEQIARTAENVGRITASREAAYQIFGEGDSAKGEQVVAQALWAENAPFRAIEHLPQVQARVMNSPSPVLEAMKIVEEFAFAQKWGKTPRDIEANIKKAYEKEIEDRVTKNLLEKMKLKDNQPHGISEARSSIPGGTNITQDATPLTQIFGR